MQEQKFRFKGHFTLNIWFISMRAISSLFMLHFNFSLKQQRIQNHWNITNHWNICPITTVTTFYRKMIQIFKRHFLLRDPNSSFCGIQKLCKKFLEPKKKFRKSKLTHFSPMFHYYTPWIQGFLTFTEAIEIEHCVPMGYILLTVAMGTW